MAEEIRQAAGQSATQRLFVVPAKSGSGWKVAWLEDCLLLLAENLGQELTKGMLKGYVAVLDVLTPEQAITAFSKALESAKYFPRPSELLDFAGRPSAHGDPLRETAKASLVVVLAAMRLYGLELKPLGGGMIDRNDSGELLEFAIRAPLRPCPPFDPVTDATVRDMGLGDRAAGLAQLAIFLQPNSGDGWSWDTNERRKTEQRWFEAYGRAKDAVKP